MDGILDKAKRIRENRKKIEVENQQRTINIERVLDDMEYRRQVRVEFSERFISKKMDNEQTP